MINKLKNKKSEYILLFFVVASLLISCYFISVKKYYWNDELYSYYLLADNSFTHMMGAFHDKINNTPPLYFILGWLWARLFGAEELSLRLFSSFGICLACVTVWITLRRTYSFWSTSIGTLAVFCTSEIILSQNAEARMYGLFLALAALAFLLFDNINKSFQVSWKVFWLNIIIHSAMINTHLFGLFYSGAILVSQFICDRYFKTFKPKSYLSIVLSWLSFFLYLPAFLIQSDAGNPRTWIPIPSLRDLIDLLSLSLSAFLNVKTLTFLIVVAGILFLYDQTIGSKTAYENDSTHLKSEIYLLVFAYGFMLGIPIFIWLFSRTVKPVFYDRYMIPSTIGWSILLAHFTSQFLDININSSWNKKTKLLLSKTTPKEFFLLTVITIFLLQPLVYGIVYPKRYIPGLNDNNYGYNNLPVVVQASAQFLERQYYSDERDKYFFILDWQSAVDESSGQFGPQEYKHLDAFKRNYPELFQNQILESEEFFNKYDRFLVLDYLEYDKKCPLKVKGLEKARTWQDLHCPRWVENKLLKNADYEVKFLGEVWGESILLVEKTT